jgi:DNA gyrase/topoisomerase IV subunit A
MVLVNGAEGIGTGWPAFIPNCTTAPPFPCTPAFIHRYMPILPMVLVNGAEGIGTGWSTFIPNYSPKEIAANLKRLLEGQPMEPMQPWYRGFK